MNGFDFDLNIHHKRLDPVFIIGANGSGKNILAGLMQKYLSINFDTDFLSFVPVYEKVAFFEDLNPDTTLKIILEHVKSLHSVQSWTKQYHLSLELQDVIKNIDAPNFQKIIDCYLLQLSVARKMLRWGYSDSNFISDFSFVNHLFPNARFIHVVRDGRDLVRGGRKNVVLPENVAEVATYWRNYLRNSKQLAVTLTAQRYIQVKYEFLISNPERVFFFLLNFLDIDDPGQQLMRFISNNAWKDLRKENIYAWEKYLSEYDQEIFERFAGDSLKEYGYQTGKRHVRIIHEPF